MRFVKPIRSGWNEIKLVTYIKWGILSPNMVMKLDSDCQIINYSWDLSNLWRTAWNEMKLGTYIKWGMLSPNMVMKLGSYFQLINYAWELSNLWSSGGNEMKLGTYIKWGILSPNMVMKLDSDCQLINYAWDLSNLWRIGWNEIKLSYVNQVRYAKSKYGHEIRQWRSANKLCMRFVKPMKEWLKWEWNLVRKSGEVC